MDRTVAPDPPLLRPQPLKSRGWPLISLRFFLLQGVGCCNHFLLGQHATSFPSLLPGSTLTTTRKNTCERSRMLTLNGLVGFANIFPHWISVSSGKLILNSLLRQAISYGWFSPIANCFLDFGECIKPKYNYACKLEWLKNHWPFLTVFGSNSVQPWLRLNAKKSNLSQGHYQFLWLASLRRSKL